MKRILISMLVILAVTFVSLPVSVSANTAETNSTIMSDQSNETGFVDMMGPFVAAGNDAYYRDNRVILRGRVVYVSTVDLHIGGDPEIRGGDQSAPAVDEIDTVLTQPIIVVTRAHSGKFLIGVVNPVIKGVQVIVRRIKATGDIIEILNCGNWTRQLGSDYTFSCPEIIGPCRPGKEETSTTEDLSIDGLTKTVVTITSDGCKTKIERTITVVKETTTNVCVAGAWLDVFEYGEANGKLGKSFKVAEVIGQLPSEVQSPINSSVGNKKKINYILVQQGACENERTNIKVRWFSKSGGWSWISFFVGVGVGFGFGFLIHGSPNNPVLNPIKSTNTPPNRTGATGSGSTGGGVISTRPRKP